MAKMQQFGYQTLLSFPYILNYAMVCEHIHSTFTNLAVIWRVPIPRTVALSGWTESSSGDVYEAAAVSSTGRTVIVIAKHAPVVKVVQPVTGRAGYVRSDGETFGIVNQGRETRHQSQLRQA